MRLILFIAPDPSRAAMAASFFNSLVNPSLAVAIGAVPDPNAALDDRAVIAMNEVEPKVNVIAPSRLTAELGAWAEEVVEVARVPGFTSMNGATWTAWDVPDMARQDARRVRDIRDWIKARVEMFLREREWLRVRRASG